MAVGIKESLEVLEAVKVLLASVKKVLADGKVGLGDIGVVFELLRQLSVLNAGVQGADQVPVELKDLDPAEAEALVAKALEIAGLFNA